MRHRGDHFLIHRHLLFDCALHAHETNTELIFEQLADRTDTAIAEMINVVHLADVLAQLQKISDDRIKVGRLQDALLERRREIQLDVELQSAHFRKIVLARVEEHAFEEGSRSFERRRIAGAQLAINFNQSFLRRLDRVLAQRQAKNNADVVALREEDRQFRYSSIDDRTNDVLGQLVVGFNDDFACIRIDHIANCKRAFEVFRIHFEPLNLCLLDVVVHG